MPFKRIKFAALPLLSLALLACNKDNTNPIITPKPQTITDLVVADPRFETLETAVKAAGLAPTLSGAGPFTVFAPTNEAFAALPAGTLTALLADPTGDLKNILLYHVVSGAVNAATVVTLTKATTVQGKDVTIKVMDGKVFLNDKVQVTVTDIMASNGIIHVINGVLLPPADPKPQTITDLVVADPRFETLETAVKAAGLAPTLSGAGPFTVFAPTNEAFDALPAGTLTALLADPTGDLKNILLYHVVSGAVNAATVVTLTKATTVQGKDVTIKVMDGKVFLNDKVQVTVTDIMASNGIIHVINGVLLPPADPKPQTITDLVVADTRFETLETAVKAAGLAPTLSGAGPFTVFAPTNEAFAALPAGTLTALLADPTGDLKNILLYHVVSGAVNAATVVTLTKATTVQGKDVTIKVMDGKVFLNDKVQVTVTDIMASNGIIHVINGVLLPPADPKPQTITDLVVADPRFETLETAVKAAGLAPTLSGAGPFTVFAPTNEAFDALPAGTLTALLADPTGDLKNILLYHVVSGAVNAATVVTLTKATTVQGKDVTIKVMDGKVFLNDKVQVTVTDIMASNGIIHVINGVLLPPADPKPQTITDLVVADPRFETLETAVKAAGLAPTLSGAGPFTVFAPTNEAFAALPAGTLTALLADPTGDLKNILLYHVLSGAVNAAKVVTLTKATTVQGKDVTIKVMDGKVFLNDKVQVTVTDIMASNGIIHVINGVLLPPADPKPQTITDLVVADPRFETLETAVKAAGLAPTLSGAGPFTVFAPTNEAFAALPAGTLTALLADPTGDLKNILLYHVLSGAVNAAKVVTLTKATTVQGKDVTIKVMDGKVFLNDKVQVTVTDIMASNGIIHVINGVLLPPADPKPQTITDLVVADPRFETLETAVKAAGLAPTLSGAGPFTVFAPTNEAFAALPAGTLTALLADPTGDLKNILLYHVLSGAVNAAKVVTLTKATTVQSKDVTIKVMDGKVFLNDKVQVTVTDIMASNGIIHVINGVLLPPADPKPQTITDLVVADPRFETLETAVKAAGLAPTLSGAGPFTVFAPTNEAFAALPAGTLTALLADPTGDLKNILLYHVLSGAVNAAKVVTLTKATTVQGKDVTIKVMDGKVFLNDKVQVTVTDIMASNGIIHVINGVLLPPADPKPQTIMELVVADPRLETLETAVNAAGFSTELSGPGPYTLFAPTNEAFDALPAGALTALLGNPRGDLQNILLYHIVSGAFNAAKVVTLTKATTLLNKDVTIKVVNGKVILNNKIQVIVTDIKASNGIIHLINGVLLPSQLPETKI